MKVIHLNTGVNKTSAPYKLHEALLRIGIESKILVLNDGDALSGVEKVPKNVLYKCKRKVYAWLRKGIMQRYNLIKYMPFTALPVGIDISGQSLVKEADVILLHWVCGDYMSPQTMKRLINTKKKIMIVCHDNYPFTGGCHVRMGCMRYMERCGLCPQLQSNEDNDITSHLVKEKVAVLQSPNVYVISPSRWMDENVSRSEVLGKQQHFILPNAINIDIFHSFDKTTVREKLNFDQDKFIILAGLKGNEKIPYNGTEFLWEVFRVLYEKCPDRKWNGRTIEIVVFGAENINTNCEFSVCNMGYIREQEKLANLYSASDVYVVTSLEDSFNQTVAECMACGTPVAAFRNGGIEDIIDHKENGYLAQYKNSTDLAEGILWASSVDKGDKVRRKIVDCFSYDKVSSRFLQIMEEIGED